MSLSLGGVTGGPEVAPSRATFMELMRATYDLQTDPNRLRPPHINVVFHFPGSLIPEKRLRIGFSSIRHGRFTKNPPMLVIQVPVPGEVTNSARPAAFILDSIRQAIRMAKVRFDSHNIPYDPTDDLKLVDLIEAGRPIDQPSDA